MGRMDKRTKAAILIITLIPIVVKKSSFTPEAGLRIMWSDLFLA